MTGYAICVLALLLGGLGPVVAMAASGSPVQRLIALELGGAVVTLLLLLLVQVTGQTYELVLPLVLVPLSFAGALVFTRLLADRGPT